MRFDVIDPGIGISRDAQRRLFQPFVQAEGSTSRHYGGTGLGLVIAAQLTAQMGGEIGLESAPGAGSTFHFTARLEKGENIERPWMSSVAGSFFSGTHALIVYESPIGRQVVASYLTAWGIENAGVANGVEALQTCEAIHARGESFSLIIVEERLADMTAVELLKNIRSDGPSRVAKAIILYSEGRVEKPSPLVDITITKPIRPSDLYSCLIKLFLNPSRDDPASRWTPAPIQIGNAGQERHKGVRVLCIDDNAVNRSIVEQQLSAMGYSATVVADAARGLEALSREKFDAVLMDCEMPRMDGYQATAEIRKREGSSAHTVVIALTAHATDGDREHCMRAGMDSYISKPVKMGALAAALDVWTHRDPNDEESATPRATSTAAGDVDEQLDPASLVRIAELGDDLLGQLVEDFLSDFDGRIASLEDALEARDLRLAASTAHNLKSASATLGAKRFCALCEKVEACARAGDEGAAISSGMELIAAARALPAMLTGATAKSTGRPVH